MIIKKKIANNPFKLVALSCIMSSAIWGMGDKTLQEFDGKKKEVDPKVAIQKVAEAIKLQDLAGIQKYIDEGGDVDADADDNYGLPEPLLVHCADHNNNAAAQLLLARGANAARSSAPLNTAICRRNGAFVELLLAHGANIEARKSGETPLLKAVRGACYSDEKERDEYLTIIDLLMRRGADIHAEQVGNRPGERESILVRVAGITDSWSFPVDWEYGIYKRLPIIKKLIRWGATGNIDTALSRRADNAKDYDEQLRKSRDFGYRYELEKTAIEELKKYREGFPALWNSTAISECLHSLNFHQTSNVKTDLERILTAFIEEPMSPKDQARSRLYAAMRDKDEVILQKILLENPDFHKERDALGYTLLLSLIYQGEYSMVSSFCGQGADLDARTNDGYTADMIIKHQLKEATKETDKERYLITKTHLDTNREMQEQIKLAQIKADQERIEKEKSDRVIQFGHLKRAIADDEPDILAQCNQTMLDEKGSALLLYAAKLGRANIVEGLLKAKVQTIARDEDYHTPLTIASINGNVETVVVLLQYLPLHQIKTMVHGGKTAYDLAREAAEKMAGLYQEKPMPEYENKMNTYKQIMALLDPYK